MFVLLYPMEVLLRGSVQFLHLSVQCYHHFENAHLDVIDTIDLGNSGGGGGGGGGVLIVARMFRTQAQPRIKWCLTQVDPVMYSNAVMLLVTESKDKSPGDCFEQETLSCVKI